MKNTIMSIVITCLLICNFASSYAQRIEIISDNKYISIDSMLKTLEKINPQKQNLRVVDELFDKFYKRADSLNDAIPILNTTHLLQQLIKEFDNKEPFVFLDKAQAMYEKNPANADEIAVLMYIGLMRFDYYVTINPNSKSITNKGWSHYEDFIQQNYKTRIELYLANNITKYEQVLEYAIDYCNKNEYTFCNKPREILAHRKVMKQYEDLYHDLTNNKNELTKKWDSNRASKLDPNSLKQQEAIANNYVNKDFLNAEINVLKLHKEKEHLWAKIQTERKDLNSSELKEYIAAFNELNNKIEENSLKRRNDYVPNIGDKITKVQTPNDNSKPIFNSSKTSLNLDTANSKFDMYKYHDEFAKKTTKNAVLTKTNLSILDYIKNMNWDEEKKLSIFILFQLHDEKKYDTLPRQQTNYLKQAEANTKPAEEFTGLNIHIKRGNRKKAMVYFILGEVEGTLVNEDLRNIIFENTKEMLKNY